MAGGMMRGFWGHPLRWIALAYSAMTLLAGLGLWFVGAAQTVSPLVVDIVLLLAPMTVTLCAGAYLTLRIRGSVEHRLWGLIVIALALILPAEAYWTWYAYAIDPMGPTTAYFVYLAYAGALVCFYHLVVDMTAYSVRPWHDRTTFFLDVLGAILALAPTIYLVWTLPLIEDLSGGTAIDAFVASIYPVVSLLIVAGALSITVGWKAYRWRVWERYLAAFFAVYAFGLFLFPLWSAQRLVTQTQPVWYSLILGFAWTLLVVAAAVRATEPRQDATFEPWPVPQILPTWFSWAYPVALAAALPVLGLAILRAQTSEDALPILVSTVLLALVLAARSVVVAIGGVSYRRVAATDPGSGALSRTAWVIDLEQAISDAIESATKVHVLELAVRDLQRMPAAFGGSVSRFLAQAVPVLADATGSSRIYAPSSDRLGVLIEHGSATDVASAARRAWLRLARESEGLQRNYDIAIGIVTAPVHATTSARALEALDMALSAARAAAAEPVVVFEPDSISVTSEEAERAARVRAVRATARQLAEAVDARDEFTKDHSANVAELATALAQVLGMSDEMVQVVGLAALMHDVGKVGVRDAVLMKRADLDAVERSEVETHPILAERILEPTGIENLLPIVRGHHERWDGTGYPDQLAGPAIPLGARILAVCDTFVSLTTPRAYRAACTVAEALDEIEGCSGSQFDPEVASTFVRMVRLLESGRTLADSDNQISVSPT